MVSLQPQLTPAQSTALAEYIDIVASALLSPKQTSPLRRSLVGSLPTSGGVYGVYRDDQLIYVGESGCLKERIGDVFETRHHSLRRTLGEELFGDTPGFERATTDRLFSPEIEKALTKFTEEHLALLAIPLKLGRKEIEEKLVGELDGLRNKRGQRGT